MTVKRLRCNVKVNGDVLKLQRQSLQIMGHFQVPWIYFHTLSSVLTACFVILYIRVCVSNTSRNVMLVLSFGE